jgi:phospholipase C
MSIATSKPSDEKVKNPEAGDQTTDNAPVTDDAATTAQLAGTGATFPTLPVGVGGAATLAVALAVGAGMAVTMRHRRMVS